MIVIFFELVQMNLENVLHTQNIFFRRLENFFDKEKDFFSISKLYFFRFSSTSRDIKFPFETVWNHKKSLTAYVYANKSRTKCRTSLLFVSMDSCDPKEVCKYHKYTMETNKKFFRTSQRQTLDQILVPFEDVGTLSKFGSPKIDADRLWIGLKSPTAHVYTNKSRTKCRTTLLFVSMGSCDPK